MSFRPFRTSVHAVTRLSPHFIRITLKGEELAEFGNEHRHYDRRIKLVFPSISGKLPTLSPNEGWYDSWLELPEEERGIMRTYSLRAVRQEEAGLFIDIDFVLHLAEGLTGPAATWANEAQVGDPLLLIGPDHSAPADAGVEFTPGTATELRLYGDETAAPAIARILEDLRPTARGHAFIEVPTAADILEIASPEGMDVTWLAREDQPHGKALTAALSDANFEQLAADTPEDAPEDPLIWETPSFSQLHNDQSVYYWIAGESSVVKMLRRELVNTHKVARQQVSFMGYWKRGVAMRG